MQVTGVISKVITKSGVTNNHSWVLHNAIIVGEGEGDAGTSFGFGFDKPAGLKEGAFVTFEAEKNARGYFDANPATLEVLKDQVPSPEIKQNVQAAVVSGDNKVKSIVLQCAYKIAPLMIDTLVNAGVLTTSGTKAVQQDNLIALIDREAARLYQFFLNPSSFEDTMNLNHETGKTNGNSEKYNPVG